MLSCALLELIFQLKYVSSILFRIIIPWNLIDFLQVWIETMMRNIVEKFSRSMLFEWPRL